MTKFTKSEMYDWMSLKKPLTPIIARGMALHKIIRFITMVHASF